MNPDRSREESLAGQWASSSSWTAELDAIDVWRVDWAMASVDDARERAVDQWAEALLGEAEHARADRLVVEAKRRQFVRSRAVLRSVLSRRLGVAAEELDFRVGEHGRPELDRVVFNLSHSGTVAVIAVGSRRTGWLGIDVERVEVDRPVERLVERFFAGSEAESFERVAETDRAADFARRWALKEAYVKALGTGLTYPSRQFVLRDDPVSWRARPLLAACARHGETHRAWSFRNLWIDVGDDRFAMALCTDDDADARTFRFDFPVRRE